MFWDEFNYNTLMWIDICMCFIIRCMTRNPNRKSTTGAASLGL